MTSRVGRWGIVMLAFAIRLTPWRRSAANATRAPPRYGDNNVARTTSALARPAGNKMLTGYAAIALRT